MEIAEHYEYVDYKLSDDENSTLTQAVNSLEENRSGILILLYHMQLLIKGTCNQKDL